MNSDTNLSQEMAKPELAVQPIKLVAKSADSLKGKTEPSDAHNRPLMVDAWSQATDEGVSLLYEMVFRDIQSQREKKLEEKVRALEETLKAHTELLSKIHATSAILVQQQAQIEPQNTMDNRNNGFNDANSLYYSNRSIQKSPQIVNTINSTQQVYSSPTESVKYRIIAEGKGNYNEEPIEIQLAEENDPLNLNSSADSGRLEICLASEENIEMKTEYNTMATQQSVMPNASVPTTPTEHENLIKKGRLTVTQHVLPPGNLKYENEPFMDSCENMPQQPTNEKFYMNGNSVLKTPNQQNQTIGIELENVMISIGPNNTLVPANFYHNINWTSASIATRKLLMAIFDRKVLATHSMTGKPSPAFKGHCKPVKEMLDPLIIADIIYAVTAKCNVSEKEVRNVITTKCADENKMMKLRLNKRTQMQEMNKENQVA